MGVRIQDRGSLWGVMTGSGLAWVATARAWVQMCEHEGLGKVPELPEKQKPAGEPSERVHFMKPPLEEPHPKAGASPATHPWEHSGTEKLILFKTKLSLGLPSKKLQDFP